MTVDEAIAIVEAKALGRTRYDGQKPFIDEILVDEIKRLRFGEVERLQLALRLARQDLKEAIKHINSELGEQSSHTGAR